MQVFEGIRILDLTRVLAGPYASYQLGLLGADVIKIEPILQGESTRWRSEGDALLGEIGMSPSFLTQGSNKRSLTLNLDEKSGQEIFLNLVRTSDVVIENLRTGSMAKRGLDYKNIASIKPDIIYCSMTGYGQTGPKSTYPAYDSVIQAATGLMSITGSTVSGPLKAGPPVVDYAMGLAGAFSISAALLAKFKTGEGQYIDLCMQDSCMALMSSVLTAYANTGVIPSLRGNEAPSKSPASTTFQTQDGLLAIAINEQHQFVHLMQTIGLSTLLDNENFDDAAKRRLHTEFLRNEIGQALMLNTASFWEPVLNHAGVPAAKVASIPEMMISDQVVDRGFFQGFSQDECGLDRDIRVPLAAFKFKNDGPKLRSPPPKVGQHSESILEELGYSREHITNLYDLGII